MFTRVTFLGLLGLLFIGLKLTGAIDWLWVWVLAPLWAPLGLALVLMIFAGILSLIVKLLERKSRR